MTDLEILKYMENRVKRLQRDIISALNCLMIEDAREITIKMIAIDEITKEIKDQIYKEVEDMYNGQKILHSRTTK